MKKKLEATRDCRDCGSALGGFGAACERGRENRSSLEEISHKDS